MRYISTHNPENTVSLKEAIGKCITCEGGLFLPESIPAIPKAFFNNIEEMNLRDIAYVVLSTFFCEDIPASELKKTIDDSFTFDAPLRGIGNNKHLLELFHGPTLTFKDFGARFMARLLRTLDYGSGRKRHILVATSGNTGAATANGFRNIEGTSVHVLFPRGTMSRLQEAQFTSLGGNIHAIEIGGSVDDCTSLVRNAIADRNLSESLNLTGAGSINVARLLPQIVFFFQAYARLKQSGVKDADKAVYAIPGGNLSNVTAAVMARRCGLPMGRIVAACGAANEFVALLGVNHDKGPLNCAPSISMSRASNLPRLLHLYGGNIDAMKNDISIHVTDNEEIASTINSYITGYSYTPDPHTAAACAASEEIDPEVPAVILATGHPAKSLDVMTRITGRAIELPVQLTRFMSASRHCSKLPPTIPALKRMLLTT